MSEFKDLFKRLETESKLERRDFMRNSLLAGLAISPLSSFIHFGLAQLPSEEITVYGKDPADVERELKKRQASALADTASDLGMASLGFATASVGFGVAAAGTGAGAGIAVLLVLEGAAFIIIGAGFFFLAHLLRMIAADPPRYPYEIDEVLTGSYYLTRAFDTLKSDTDRLLLTDINDLVISLKSTWDHLEWWQAAKEEQDSKWMQMHADQFWTNFDVFASKLSELSVSLKAAVENLNTQLALPNNQSIFDATQQVAGKRLADIKAAREILNKTLDWDSKMFNDGVREQLRADLQSVVLKPVSQSDFQTLLEDLNKHARYFASV